MYICTHPSFLFLSVARVCTSYAVSTKRRGKKPSFAEHERSHGVIHTSYSQGGISSILFNFSITGRSFCKFAVVERLAWPGLAKTWSAISPTLPQGGLSSQAVSNRTFQAIFFACVLCRPLFLPAYLSLCIKIRSCLADAALRHHFHLDCPFSSPPLSFPFPSFRF